MPADCRQTLLDMVAQRNPDSLPVVLMDHTTVSGCDFKGHDLITDYTVGGIDGIMVDDLGTGYDYVALGHIHGPQNIGTNRIRYCGTPLKYSFSEEHHHKSVTVVNLGEKGQLELQLRPLTPKLDLRSMRGSFGKLYEGAPSDDYLHIILTDEEDVPEAIGKLRPIYPNIMKLSYDNTRTRCDREIGGAQDVQVKSPLQLFEELYEQQNNQPMSDIQQAFMRDLIEHIWEAAK